MLTVIELKKCMRKQNYYKYSTDPNAAVTHHCGDKSGYATLFISECEPRVEREQAEQSTFQTDDKATCKDLILLFALWQHTLSRFVENGAVYAKVSEMEVFRRRYAHDCFNLVIMQSEVIYCFTSNPITTTETGSRRVLGFMHRYILYKKCAWVWICSFSAYMSTACLNGAVFKPCKH